ncbi:GmrSD restriction endonuclease domain-containing protein [Helicobacter vulpis]|uniref:GmrSD restriction endonuclease domain-containing protein n=1 Tax=Helicobacter vulpis TaxID=2316076 RepID=UPI000EB1F348|nr:DUF262 domain-containing protein [Helicobacter vulpis]
MRFLKPYYAEYEFKDIIERLDRGEYVIPRFQRDFVWTIKKAAEFIDSMLKGFPTGAFILWKTKEHLAHNREIKGVCSNAIKNDDYVYYVLDGQQRMTALMYAYKGLTHQRGPRSKDNYQDIRILAHPNIEGDYCVVAKKNERLEGAVAVCDLIKLHTYDLEDKYQLQRESAKPFIGLQRQIEKYRFPTIEIADTSIEEIVEIFTRINTGGTKLNLSQILYARFYMPPNQGDFDLEARFSTLSSDLDKLDFKLSNALGVVQLISYTLKEGLPLKERIATPAIMRLDPHSVRDQWEKIALCFKSAVEFCKHSLKIPSIDFLPTEFTLLPLAYFFYCNHNKPASAHQKEQLQKLFFRCCFFGAHQGDSLLKQLGLAEEIYKGEFVDFDAKLPFFSVSEAFLMGEPLNIRTGLQKTIFLVLAILGPKDFRNNSPVVLDHLFLEHRTQRNLHHFYPKNHLKKLGWPDKAADVIANMTLISANLNQEIKDKAPQEYIQECRQSNKDLDQTLQTHLIDLSHPNVLVDYKAFLKMRARAIMDKIKEMI